MNRFIQILLAFGLTSFSYAQNNVTAAEYYIDTDPGEGLGTAITASDGSFNSTSEDISLSLTTSSLSFGRHYIFIRYKDTNNGWGESKAVALDIANPEGQTDYVMATEYFVDTDPGKALGIALTAVDGSFNSDEENVTGTINTSTLSSGSHKVYVRAKGSRGGWGVTSTISLEVTYIGPSWYISQDGNDSTGDGTKDNPFATIQKGIDSSSNGDTVFVAAGTYTENINYSGKNIVVGSMYLTTRDTSYISSTIIDGNQNGSVVKFVSGEDTTAVLSGFTIKNGLGDIYTSGGGVYCSNSSATLKNLIITNNSSGQGGGIRAYYSKLLIINSLITNNEASCGGCSRAGGGILLVCSEAKISNSIIDSNISYGGAGGIGTGGGNDCIANGGSMLLEITNSTISNNTAGSSDNAWGGGGMGLGAGINNIENCSIYNNEANYGAGIMLSGSSSENISTCNITNCSIIENYSYSVEAETYFYNQLFSNYNSHYYITNSILYSVHPIQIQLNRSSDSVTVNYTDIMSGVNSIMGSNISWEDGNIDADPLFADKTNGDYHLQNMSPCIDTGDPNSPVDPDGTRADMGAYYYPHVNVEITSTASSPTITSPIPITVTFSGSVTGFESGDITVDNGTVSSFSGSGATYTVNVTPTSDGVVTVDIPAGVCTDAAGNPNTAVSQFSITYDGTAPTISSVSLGSDFSTIAVTMSEAVYNTNGGSGALEASDFALSISGGAATVTATPSSISASGNVYTLGITLSGTPNGSETLTVNPVDDSIYDAAGNEASTSQSNNTVSLNSQISDTKEYTGTTLTVNQANVGEGTLTISDKGTIKDVNVKLSTGANVSLPYWQLKLISPYGTVVDLIKKEGNGHTLNNTVLDDEASTTIKDGIDPHSGSYQPAGSLSDFDEEEMQGTWTLWTYHESAYTSISAWSVIIDFNHFTPKDPPAADPGTEYKGTALTVSQTNVGEGTLTISDEGIIKDVNVKLSTGVNVSLPYWQLKLISPYGTEVYLINKEGNGHVLNNTVLDDEASTTIKDGIDPHFGSYQPAGSLSDFDEEKMQGTWTLWTYHESAYTSISAWSVIIDFITGGPKATISSTVTSPTNKSSIPIKVQFDRDVTGFVLSDLTLGNGSMTNFAGSGSYYTFDMTPSADGNVTVDISSAVAKDSDNIDNIASDQFLIVSDRTVPITGTVNDGTGNDIDIQNTSSTLNANWTGFSDALSGIASYDWAIGTSSGGTEILDWTNAGNTTSASKSNLSLINDQTYYISVRVIDKAGNTSTVATSDGVKTDFSSPSAPTDFVATSNDGSITLQWTKNTESDIANYKIYRGTQAGFSLSSDSLIYSASATETQYVDQQVVYGVTHYYKMTATDLAGNEGTASSEVNGRSIDTKPPTVSISAPANGNSFGTEDQVTISWQASDNWQLSWAKSYYRYSSNDQFVFIDSTDATVAQHNWQVPDSTISTTCDILVIVSDIESNTTRDTMSGVFTITDNTSPTISISKPASGSSVKEYNYIDVAWTSTDNIAMDSIKVYHSSSQNGSYLLQKSISSDSTNTSYAVPVGVSDEASVKLVAIDKSGNTKQAISAYFTVIDNTPPTVSISSPSQNDQFEIGNALTVSWTGYDNIGITSTDINYSIDGGTAWNETAKNLTGLETYQWLAPNFPTNNLIIQVIVHDAVDLSDTSTVSNVGIYPVYPKVVTIDPEPGTLRWLHEDISVTFSRAMDATTITKQNVIVTSQYSSEPELLYNSSDKKLIIRNSSGYVSLDTIKITLNALGLKSTFGYQMDGDGDGSAGGDSTLQYNSIMLADFDTTNTIDVSDLAIMLNALETKDYYYDIGPVINTVPHFLVQPDSKIDIEDVMSFVMMWNWYNQTNSSSIDRWISSGDPVNLEYDHKGIVIEFPPAAVAGQVQILGLNGRLEYGINKDNQYLGLEYFNEETQFFTYLTERNKDGIIEIPIKIKGKSTDLEMSYKFVDEHGNVISQATQSIKIENIPEQFKLHQNYPNPFNPVTTINYDLPQQTYVNLMIYDILGREVVKLVSKEIPAGYQSVIWNTRNSFGQPVSAGIYFYQIQTKDFVKTRKMVLLK